MRLFLFIILLLAAVGSALLYRDYQAFLDAPLKKEAAFTVKPGASIQTIAEELKAQGIIRSALYLQLYARLNHLATRIKAGEYALGAELTPRELLAKLVEGDVIQYSLTVLEGWTFRQMLAAVHSHPHLRPTLRGFSDAAIMARLGYPGEHPEGRFFPDTYHFPNGTTDLDFLQRAYQTMQRRLQAAWEQRQPALILQSPYQALTLASIVEKETALASERAQVAGVFIRRLQKNMRLQTDPTVIYGLGAQFDGNLRRADLERDTPYNTYTRSGLPPTPIALPGAASLAAAVNPADGDALYFVAKGDGSHAFSDSLRQHNQAVQQYQLGQQ